jgi:hypothetical protein
VAAHLTSPARSRRPAAEPSAELREELPHPLGPEPAETGVPLTSEPPLPGAEPLTSEPPLTGESGESGASTTTRP